MPGHLHFRLMCSYGKNGKWYERVTDAVIENGRINDKKVRNLYLVSYMTLSIVESFNMFYINFEILYL